MNWYIAKLVYQIMIDNGEYAPQFEEQLRLINADNQKEALLKASELGEEEESLFYNHRDEPIYWKFIDVAELRPIQKLNNGLQLASHIEQPEIAENYLALMLSKAESIRQEENLVL